ncbi:hypothetical protein ABUW04_33265 [Streptacidiphilus sp. N1-10]|uniref:Uncharacterized protein n=1 Tax=Streptacidiphilus jeojiensis TaxID=3229225 RepID=A0ABV6XY02_9ACTN
MAVQRLLKSPLLTVAELVAELQGRARILGLVRAVFDGSYRTLRPATARMVRLLGTAPGSDLSTGAITALWSGHLLAPGRPDRYMVHDLLQAYAAEIAASELYQEESDAGLDRLGRWYARTAGLPFGRRGPAVVRRRGGEPVGYGRGALLSAVA